MFDEIGGYDENYKYAQDYKFFIDAKLKGYKIFTIDTPLYYLNTKNNISNNYYEEQMYYSKKPQNITWKISNEFCLLY